ncbi:radical SAM protein [Anabaena subtropica]|uniref:Radical SAM protein n=1 Tax=Anabaena subtropica FACHB-260 TaxID=2692884 RepID=A0ABR8CHD7_9NOST|nr:radical SAM protein [Anabaena subtropica]MBD2342607.1 radical SAM protein [Anabaena subtropica FACHB-260]
MTVAVLQQHIDNVKRAQLISDKYLELIILPTEQCNFRCVYCYEDFSIGRMKSETISGIKALIEKRCPTLSYLNLSWFGGEPLVAKDTVLDISEYAMSLAGNYSHLHYSGSMTTNAYFLDINTASALANVGVTHYQISLDGPMEIHNKSRIRADGKNTFERIWSNLLAIRDSLLPVSVLLRLHFTADTFDLLDPLLEDIKRELLPDPRFSAFFKAIEHLGGPNDTSIKVFSETEKAKAIKILENKLFGDNLKSSQNGAVPDNAVCYAARPNSLVIRANGKVGKCTVALTDERNDIGTLASDGKLKLIPGRFAPWVRGIETLDIDTLACPLVLLPTSDEITANLRKKALTV